MPFFFRNSRLPSFDDPFLLSPDNTHSGAFSWTHDGSSTKDDTRPHTSHGISRRKFTAPSATSTPWLNLPRRASTLTSRSTTALPLSTVDQAASPVAAVDVPSRYEEVGLALGSPSEMHFPQHTFSPSPLNNIRDFEMPSEEPEPNVRTNTEPQTTPSRPKVKRWKTVSGLFARKKTYTSRSPPLIRVSEDTFESQAAEAEKPKITRSSSYFHRKSKASSPEISTDLPDMGSRRLLTPTPGEARAAEAGEDYLTPRLRIEIPDAGFDRYSIMFSNLLQHSMLQSTPSPAPGSTKSESGAQQPVSIVEEKQLPELPPTIVPDSPYPMRTQSLRPRGSQVRISALPTPLFAHPTPRTQSPELQIQKLQPQVQSQAQPETQPQPPSLQRAKTIADLPLAPWYTRTTLNIQNLPTTTEDPNTTNAIPADIEAWALGKSPLDTHFDASARRYSLDSYLTLTSVAPSPALTISTFRDSVIDGSGMEMNIEIGSPSPALPLFKFPAPPSAEPSNVSSASTSTTPSKPSPTVTEVGSNQKEGETLLLTIPSSRLLRTHSNRTSWDAAIPPSSSSGSPRLKFGYDAPCSPTVAMATTVTVSVRRGEGVGQRPQFVVRERGVDGNGEEAVDAEWARRISCQAVAVEVE